MEIFDPYDLLTKKKNKAKYLGECKFHKKYFGKELIVERNQLPTLGYYLCYDCQKMRRKEREMGYTRKNGNPVRLKMSRT